MNAQTRALLLSVMALAVPVTAAFLVPEKFSDYEALLWLVALVPAFLFAYQRGWRGAGLALALGMAVLSLTYAATEIVGREPPEILAPVVVAFIFLTIGIGAMAEGLHRQRRKGPDAADLVDPVTGLPTWRYARRYLETEWDAATRGRSLVLVVFDMDGLEEYCSRHGRMAGDEGILRIAEILRQNTRQMNISARITDVGGRFLSVLSGSDPHGASIFAHRALDAFRAADGPLPLPTVSVGVAPYHPGMSHPDDLMEAAAEAARRAREEGGDRVRVLGMDIAVPEDEDGVTMMRLEEGVPSVELISTCLLVGDRAGEPELEQVLEERSVRVVTVSHAEAARALLEQDYDLLVLDLSLPGSLELTEALRARGRTTQMVGITPEDAPALAVQALNGGVAHCLIRPYDREDVLRALRKTIPQRWQALERFGVTEELRARNRAVQRNLEETEARYRRVVEQIREVVFQMGPDGRLLFLNSAWERMTGFPVEESVGTSFFDFVAAQDRQATEARMRRLLEGEVDYEQLQLRLGRNEGDADPWIDLTASSRRAQDGELLHVSGTMIDISDRRRLEDQLRQSQRMEAVGRLAGGIAHDFNNILTSIRGHAELTLVEQPEDSVLVSDLREIVRSTDRASALTSQLVAFSRNQVLKTRLLDLGEVVRGMEPMLRRLIGGHIDIQATFSPDRGSVQADPSQLEQIVLNLAVNARDAMPGGGRLELRVANADVRVGHVEGWPEAVRPGPYVRLTVQDTGRGIPAEVRPHIFEPFFTTRASEGGSGLGLATVYGIASQSGGFVEVESEVGMGTAFHIYLPLRSRQEPVEPAERAATPVQSVVPGGGRTVLLVEDDPAVRRVTARMLERAGYSVVEAASPEEVLAAREEILSTTDLVVTDVLMPYMSGPELAERLRSVRPRLPILFISGYPAEDRLGNREEGEVTFLKKPFGEEELTALVSTLLEASRPS